ncbi:MAG: hypothetical protein ACRCU6_01890 [Fusobacteriaceae bacterium]
MIIGWTDGLMGVHKTFTYIERLIQIYRCMLNGWIDGHIDIGGRMDESINRLLDK